LVIYVVSTFDHSFLFIVLSCRSVKTLSQNFLQGLSMQRLNIYRLQTKLQIGSTSLSLPYSMSLPFYLSLSLCSPQLSWLDSVAWKIHTPTKFA